MKTENWKMNAYLYERDLQNQKQWDEVQFSKFLHGYQFIVTAGHGYLVVPKNDVNIALAERICEYGFRGKHAIYLEEDCEAEDFFNGIHEKYKQPLDKHKDTVV